MTTRFLRSGTFPAVPTDRARRFFFRKGRQLLHELRSDEDNCLLIWKRRNPNRIEQRFGRIHRIGQTEVCHLWNVVAEETREGDVYYTLLKKLEQARQALGGQVFDVLGKIQFEGRPLRELLIQAIRYGERPEVRARLSIETVQAFLNGKTLEGKAVQTIKNLKWGLSSIFVAAIKYGYMLSNPAQGTELPPEPIRERKKFPSFAELSLLIERLQNRSAR